MATIVSKGFQPGSDLISNGATAGQVPVADGFNRTFWTTLSSPVGQVEEFTGFIPSPADDSYTINLYASYACTINILKIITSAGTATAAVKINATSVTGISAVSVTSTIATGTASAANTVAAGDKISLVLSSTAAAANLAFTLQVTRT